MSEMYDEVKALVNCISEDTDDYPDQACYRMVMNRLGHVKTKLFQIEESRAKAKAHKALQKRRELKAEEEWQNADLGYDDEEDVQIESDGWNIDVTHFSRVYYVSINGEQSVKYNFSIEFAEGIIDIISIGCSSD